jgi:hypothetical protein
LRPNFCATNADFADLAPDFRSEDQGVFAEILFEIGESRLHDYSLHGIENRFAKEGEVLVVEQAIQFLEVEEPL